MSIGVFLGIIALMFVIELPDKTFVATIIMAARSRPTSVLLGGALALVTQMFIATQAGRLLTLFPVNVKNLIVALFFLGGAAYLLFVPEKEEEEKGEEEGERLRTGSRWREVSTAFTVIFIGEMGDLTQIQAANLSARTHQPIEVFLAASIAMVAVTAVGAFGGQVLVRRVPLGRIRFAGGLIFAGLGIYTLVKLATG
ncbi:MAG: TMEM165/GDT1 family protein [Acidimicrobiales bacterium]